MTDKNQLPLEPDKNSFRPDQPAEEGQLSNDSLTQELAGWEQELLAEQQLSTDQENIDESLVELELLEEPELPAEQAPLSPAFDTDLFTDPFVDHGIEADEQAYAYHGMTHPSDPEPDYSIYFNEEPAQNNTDPAGSFRDPLAEEEFSAMFSAEQKQEEHEVTHTKPRPTRKGRPKKKKGDGLFGIPHLLSSVVWIAIILVIGVTLGRMLWVCAADVLAFGRSDRAVTITITSDDTIESIADKLHDAGLIRYPGLFQLYAGLAVDEGEISPGTFTLNTLYDYHALVNGMHSSSSYRAVLEDVLIPEGYSCRQIFELLEEKGICTVKELEDYAANGEFADYWFLEDIERGDKYCLEGYLFPDTYDFYENSTPREALGKMLTGFEYRVNEQMYGKLDTLNARLANIMRSNGRSEDYINSHLLSFHDVVIVASLIEKESGSNSESYNIASVIYNRLFNWGSTPAYLNIDAALIYAMDGDATNIDTSIDHPYNTYKNIGLTPGPIANPGLASLDAALSPADTGYYFYVLNPTTGQHSFSKTLEEHENLVEKYNQG